LQPYVELRQHDRRRARARHIRENRFDHYIP